MEPTIGRFVTYRTDGRNGMSYDLPAIITCTAYTHPGNYPDGDNNPLPIPGPDEVHLTVFTPGGVGTKLHDPDGEPIAPSSDQDFKGALKLVPGSGTYVELLVRRAEDPLDPADRTWRWPEEG